MGSNSIKGSSCCREQETSLSLLSTCWFQERIRAWFHNQTKIKWGLLSLLVRYYQNLNQTNINTATQALKYKHCHTSTQIQTLPHKHSNTNTATQALKYKHCHTSTQIQTLPHKHSNINTATQALKYKQRNGITSIMTWTCLSFLHQAFYRIQIWYPMF